MHKLDLRISGATLAPQAEQAKAELWILFPQYFNYYLKKGTSWFSGNPVMEERAHLGHLSPVCTVLSGHLGRIMFCACSLERP